MVSRSWVPTGHQGPLSSQVVVQLVLQVDEAVVGLLCQAHISQNSGYQHLSHADGLVSLENY
jgi:hypothetical protein